MPEVRRRGDSLTNKLLLSVLVALVIGAFSAYTDAIRRDEKLKALIENMGEMKSDIRNMKDDIREVRDAAHTHGRDTRIFLPDAEPE
jgi:hypothetical protein